MEPIAGQRCCVAEIAGEKRFEDGNVVNLPLRKTWECQLARIIALVVLEQGEHAEGIDTGGSFPCTTLS